MKDYLLTCACHSNEHTIIVHKDEEDNVFYFSIFLKELGFVERLKLGIKYIFGYKCKYGHFEEIIITPEQLNKLK